MLQLIGNASNQTKPHRTRQPEEKFDSLTSSWRRMFLGLLKQSRFVTRTRASRDVTKRTSLEDVILSKWSPISLGQIENCLRILVFRNSIKTRQKDERIQFVSFLFLVFIILSPFVYWNVFISEENKNLYSQHSYMSANVIQVCLQYRISLRCLFRQSYSLAQFVLN